MENIVIEHKDISPEHLAYLKEHPEDAAKAINIGVMVIMQVQASRDMDFVKHEVEKLTLNLENSVTVLTANAGKIIDEVISKKIDANFNPDIPGSYPVKFGSFLNEKTATLTETVKNKTAEINDLIRRVEENTSEKDGSLLGRLKLSVQETQEFLSKEFDPTNTNSYTFKLKEGITVYIGELDTKLETKIRAEMSEALKPLMEQFISLREVISKEEGKEEIFEKTAIKGFEFETVMMEKLGNIAASFGDVVEQTGLEKETTGSMKGDFMYQFNGSKIVIEAKDKQSIRQKESLDYMKEAMKHRVADFGILVAADAEQLQKQIGSWNIYDKKVIICSFADLEMSLKVARLLTQLTSTREEGSVNVGLIDGKCVKLIQDMKQLTNMKQKITLISNSTVEGLTNLRGQIDTFEDIMLESIKEIQIEIKQ